MNRICCGVSLLATSSLSGNEYPGGQVASLAPGRTMEITKAGGRCIPQYGLIHENDCEVNPHVSVV
jgi:hypothetical protein